MSLSADLFIKKGQKVKVCNEWKIITEVMTSICSNPYDIHFRLGNDHSYEARNKDKLYSLGEIEAIEVNNKIINKDEIDSIIEIGNYINI